MATKNEKLLEEEIQLLLYKHYHTFQGIYDVCSTNLSVHDLFLKTILHCIDWIKERIGKDKIDEYLQLQDFNKFPKPEEYAAFDINNVKDFQIIDTLEVRSLYVEEEKGWTFRITEPGNGMECSKYPNRVYITNLSVYEEETSVKFSIRVTCKEPETNSEDSDVPLPQIIRKLYFDNDLLLKESKLSKKYEFSDKPIKINGKQVDECEDFVTNFYFNEDRQMPILLCPVKEYEEAPEFIEQLNQQLVGACHVVVAENGYNKLFSTRFGSDQEIIDNLRDARNYVLLHGNNSIDLDDRKFIIKMNWVSREQEAMLDENMHNRLANSSRKEILGRIIESALQAQRFKHYDYQGYKFYKELRRYANEKLIGMGNPDKESQMVNSLKEQIEILETEKSEATRNAYNYKHEISKKESACKALEEHLIQMMDKCNELEEKLNAEKEKNKDLRKNSREILAASEGRVYESKEETQDKAQEAHIKELWEPIINIPMSEGRVYKDGIVDWINKYYGDVIVVNKKAVASLKKAKPNIDYHTVCLMIHYLYGYTKAINEGGKNPLDTTIAREYDILSIGCKANPSYTGEATPNQFREAYKIDYEGIDGTSKSAMLDWHIRSGGGRDCSCIAIYFHYDSEDKRVYIGSLPEHLPTRENPT